MQQAEHGQAVGVVNILTIRLPADFTIICACLAGEILGTVLGKLIAGG
jgi:hypothetical protein